MHALHKRGPGRGRTLAPIKGLDVVGGRANRQLPGDGRHGSDFKRLHHLRRSHVHSGQASHEFVRR
ncbi:MAG: hypothetical protein OXJ64_10760, partial [Boseongicola sp.]|nr:hypothetical protein [Boseongicola sp.]